MLKRLLRYMAGLVLFGRRRGPERESVRRLELANGGWWDIETRPTMREFMKIQEIIEAASDEQAAFEVLAYLTKGWSFPEEVSAEAVMDRHVDELVDAMTVFTTDVGPFLEGAPSRLRPSVSSTTSSESESLESTS